MISKVTPKRPDHEQAVKQLAWVNEKSSDRSEISVDPPLPTPKEGATFRNRCVTFTKLFVCFVTGIVFGICAEKSRVYEPINIRQQFVFTNFIMLKMFLSAVLSGQVVLIVLSLISITRRKFEKCVETFVECLSERGILASSMGPFLLGIGMALAGACPGMTMVQLGTWTPFAILTFCGGLVGTLLYGLLADHVTNWIRPKTKFTKHTVFEKLNLPFAVVALPMVLILLAVVVCLEYFIPWSSVGQLTVPNSPTATIITARAWPPFASGLVIGLLQMIIIFSVDDSLGSTSAYVTLVSQWVVTEKLMNRFPYLARARVGLGNWWQVFYLFGIVLGGGVSAISSNTYMSVKGVHPAAAFFGGFLMLVGSRLGAGCTSGHGLSGMAVLAWLSFLAVPMMFAGGIGTSFAMYATGALGDIYSWS